MSSKLESAIWSRDTGQRVPCFDRCQLTITWMSNIKDVCCELVGADGRHVWHKYSKREPAIWSRDTSHIGIHGGLDGRTYGRKADRH